MPAARPRAPCATWCATSRRSGCPVWIPRSCSCSPPNRPRSGGATRGTGTSTGQRARSSRGRRGIQHVGFMGEAPHYLQDSENPAAIQSLVSYTARLLHLSPDMSHFAEAIQDFRTQCDKAVARDRATREHVRKLEQEYDAEVGEERPPLPGGELDSEKLMQELEEFLRKQREGGTEGR